MMPTDDVLSSSSRRTFLKHSTAAVVGGAVATHGLMRSAHASGSDVLKVGLIGCGGRGTGAAINALRADPNVHLTALADAFPDRIQHCRNVLSRQDFAERIAIRDEECFSGFDAYKGVMATDVDVVLLCSPPHFRPDHLEAAVAAGKHIFCEKPVAVDAPGVRRVLATAAAAKEKNLSIVSGLCWRYDHGVRETMKRIQDGAIGDIVTIQENYLTGELWHRGRKPEWSEMEYQMRNWLYFTWLSGDHIVEQFIHSLDKALWLMNDEPPVRCYGLGGRQVRTDPAYGHVYDHFAVCYEWANGVRTFANTRQMKNCFNEVEDFVFGSKGQAKVLAHQITPKSGDAWKYTGDRPSMYDVEHQELFAGIRSGNIINNGEYMSYSTMMAILGREVCYTGQNITWEQGMASQMDLTPSDYVWGDVPTPTVAIPGVSRFS